MLPGVCSSGKATATGDVGAVISLPAPLCHLMLRALPSSAQQGLTRAPQSKSLGLWLRGDAARGAPRQLSAATSTLSSDGQAVLCERSVCC